ncbi:MAG TPA: S8 family peptidase [Thermoanaerobaculia bacterium]|nr:S8 family peptidase [Thermoanaerobaculia bacterium]
MAEPEEKQPPQKIDRKLLEQLMFGTGRVRRFTQDSPVLPDVWLEYAKTPEERTSLPSSRTRPGEPFPPVKLLLTPYREHSTGDVRIELRERLARKREEPAWEAFKHFSAPLPRVIYNQSTVAVDLYFEELIRIVLPMTDWWSLLSQEWKIGTLGVATEETLTLLAQAIKDPERAKPIPIGKKNVRFPTAMLWMIRVAGALAIIHRGGTLPPKFLEKNGVAGATEEDWKEIVRVFAELVRGISPAEEEARIYAVSLNREASPTIARSTLAIKADAARLLFSISCSSLAWAIVDSGVDASHPAFRQVQGKDKDKETFYPEAFPVEDGKTVNRSRVVATYDFTQIDLLLDPDTEEWPEKIQRQLDAGGAGAEALRKDLDRLKDSLKSGRSLDWKLIAPFLRIPHESPVAGEKDEGNKYLPPGLDHGTHVAGILASNWKQDPPDKRWENLVGVCPDLRLYDLRVLNAEGQGDEFSVMAALQFVRYLNSTNDFMVVHGVNLSLSIPHDVSNYACGRTPVCEECERVVSSGIVVVAAAGNQGYRKYTTEEGGTTTAYNSISITDPGNADLIITVGATHRFRPHTYGVSYFSSRGPTGDGRSKPDLVAPGEKITSPLPDGLFGLKDGTSMAAPHVSGAAALLMARYNELVGRPARIKQILCDTATDLGREKYFQGAGMLDVLRALQSV